MTMQCTRCWASGYFKIARKQCWLSWNGGVLPYAAEGKVGIRVEPILYIRANNGKGIPDGITFRLRDGDYDDDDADDRKEEKLNN